MLTDLFAGLTLLLASLFGLHQTSPTPQPPPAPAIPPAQILPSPSFVSATSAPFVASSTIGISGGVARRSPQLASQPLIQPAIQPTLTSAGDWISADALTVILGAMHRSLRDETIRIVGNSVGASFDRLDIGGGLQLADLTDANIPDTITASNYLTLTGGGLSGNLAIGTSSSASPLSLFSDSADASPQIHAVKVGGSNTIRLETYRNSAFASQFYGYHARGTPDAPQPLTSADHLFRLAGAGHTGDTFRDGAEITARATETWSETNQGTLILFNTVEAGTATFSTKFTIGGRNVGIGTGTVEPSTRLTVVAHDTTTPQFRLQSFRSGIVANHIVGGIEFASNDSNLTAPGIVTASIRALANQTHTASALGTDLTFSSTNGTAFAELARLTGSGNYGVGTTSPWRKLSVTGTVGFDGLTDATGAGSLCLDANKQVVYNSASDACLSSTRATKRDIGPLDLDALTTISALEPVSFVYNEGDGRTRYGFIAEDAAAIANSLATYNASSTVSGIDDRAVLSVVVKAIKEIAAQITLLFDNVTHHDAELEAIKARLHDIENRIRPSTVTAPSAPASAPMVQPEVPDGPTADITTDRPAVDEL